MALALAEMLQGMDINDIREGVKQYRAGGGDAVILAPRRPPAPAPDAKAPRARKRPVACRNCPAGARAKWYTGEEPSPNGLGYSAAFADVDTRMKGRNGNWWVTKTNVLGVHTWRQEKAAKAAKA